MLALWIFVIAGISDYFDGMLARKLKCSSDFGKVADPLADKIIVTAALITLVIPLDYINYYIVAIIVFREIFITILRNHNKKKKIYIAANIWGKLKTVLQMIGIITALTLEAFMPYIKPLVSYETEIKFGIELFFWLVVMVTVISGVTYLPIFGKKAK